MSQSLTPGVLVVHPDQPDWGIGQIQSVIGNRITVNFEHRGKVLINGAVISLTIKDERD
jgi:hypothetical protein